MGSERSRIVAVGRADSSITDTRDAGCQYHQPQGLSRKRIWQVSVSLLEHPASIQQMVWPSSQTLSIPTCNQLSPAGLACLRPEMPRNDS